ncbi:MAG TPA: GntR family transcriptional regulator [Candidatus Baltobacteraceae bacterium]
MIEPSFAIVVDPDIETPPYLQIEDQIRAFVERGDLQPGMPLPTVRQLAGDLDVAPNTVARAYADLQNDGWLVSEGRRGTRVAGSPPSQDKKVRIASLQESVETFINLLRHRGFTTAEITAALRPPRSR